MSNGVTSLRPFDFSTVSKTTQQPLQNLNFEDAPTDAFTADLARDLKTLLPDSMKDVAKIVDVFMELKSQQGISDTLAHKFILALRSHETVQPFDMIWARLSDSQEYMVRECAPASWPQFRERGMSLWVRDVNVLKQQLELVARAQFMQADGGKDPVACALLYMALGKRKLWTGLWRVCGGHPEQ